MAERGVFLLLGGRCVCVQAGKLRVRFLFLSLFTSKGSSTFFLSVREGGFVPPLFTFVTLRTRILYWGPVLLDYI